MFAQFGLYNLLKVYKFEEVRWFQTWLAEPIKVRLGWIVAHNKFQRMFLSNSSSISKSVSTHCNPLLATYKMIFLILFFLIKTSLLRFFLNIIVKLSNNRETCQLHVSVSNSMFPTFSNWVIFLHHSGFSHWPCPRLANIACWKVGIYVNSMNINGIYLLLLLLLLMSNSNSINIQGKPSVENWFTVKFKV